MHTAEPVGLDPAEWLRTGLVSNTGMWVQGQPGIGKSTIVKRLLVGLVGFGMTAVIPGDVKGEYTPWSRPWAGAVWRIGRGRHALNPLDAGPLRAALAAAVGTDRDRLARPSAPGGCRCSRPCWSIVRRARDHRHRTPAARRRASTSPSPRRPAPASPTDPRRACGSR